jgi:hypothetical protein
MTVQDRYLAVKGYGSLGLPLMALIASSDG